MVGGFQRAPMKTWILGAGGYNHDNSGGFQSAPRKTWILLTE